MTLSTTPRMVHMRTQLEELKKLASEPNIFVKPSKAERRLALREAMRCSCGAMPFTTEEGDSICTACGDLGIEEEKEQVTCDECGEYLPSQVYKENHSGFCSDCLFLFNL